MVELNNGIKIPNLDLLCDHGQFLRSHRKKSIILMRKFFLVSVTWVRNCLGLFLAILPGYLTTKSVFLSSIYEEEDRSIHLCYGSWYLNIRPFDLKNCAENIHFFCADNDGQWQNTEPQCSAVCLEEGRGISAYTSIRYPICQVWTQVPRDWFGERVGWHRRESARNDPYATGASWGSWSLHSREIPWKNPHGFQRCYPFSPWLLRSRKCLGLSWHWWPGVILRQ